MMTGSIVIKFSYQCTGTMVVILKLVGTADCDRERFNKALRMRLGMPSGPAALRGLTHLNVFFTSTTEKQSPQSLVAGHVGGTVLSSKHADNVFSLSGSNTTVLRRGWFSFCHLVRVGFNSPGGYYIS
jgi:hypothetical protein